MILKENIKCHKSTKVSCSLSVAFLWHTRDINIIQIVFYIILHEACIQWIYFYSVITFGQWERDFSGNKYLNDMSGGRAFCNKLWKIFTTKIWRFFHLGLVHLLRNAIRVGVKDLLRLILILFYFICVM